MSKLNKLLEDEVEKLSSNPLDVPVAVSPARSGSMPASFYTPAGLTPGGPMILPSSRSTVPDGPTFRSVSVESPPVRAELPPARRSPPDFARERAPSDSSSDTGKSADALKEQYSAPAPPPPPPEPLRPVTPFRSTDAESPKVGQRTAGENAFVDELFSKVRPLLDVIDRLRDVGCEKLIQLPRIAVVGEQSTGKTSVLESLVGEDFLPKSDELATRVPVWLRMIRDPMTSGLRAFVGAAPDNKQFVSLQNLAPAVRHYTDQIAGTSKNIVNRAIFIDIYAPDCPDLTLVDLPGIAKNPIHGSDQPDNIEDITKDLIAEYIKDKETVILAVVPANMDIAASDAIKIARKYDPSGDRTVGVLTKVDIMDMGTNARKILSGEYVKLKLGFVAVKNRSQKELNDGVTVRQALVEESKFFSTHAAYRDMNPSLFGAKHLSRRLMQILANRIVEILPTLKDQVAGKLDEVDDGLSLLGDEMPESDSSKRRMIISLLKEYADAIANLLEGHVGGRYERVVLDDQLFGMAVISNYFEEFAHSIGNMSIDKLVSDDEIKRQIRNTAGTCLPNFLSFRTFKLLVKPPIERISRPSVECVDKTHRYLQELCYKFARDIFGRFPVLLESVRVITDALLNDLRTDAKEKIGHIIEHQRYVYTSNPEYLRLTVPRGPAPRASSSGLVDEPPALLPPDEARELRMRLSAYYELVKKVIVDEVTRTIGWAFQNGLQTRLFLDLESSLAETDSIDRVMAESPDKTELRKRLKSEKEILSESMAVLSKSREQLYL